MNKKIKYVVGIDEAGRGPLAGPVAVGAILFYVPRSKQNEHAELFARRALKKLFPGARDSKKLSAKKREEIFAKIKEAERWNSLQYTVVNQSAKIIDKKGISWAIKNCIKKCLKELKVNPKRAMILLDGGIKAPEEFIYQKTIIGGDDKEIVISLASICVKVTRDAHMKKLAKKYPLYGLEKHKGYGTLRHRVAIQKHGPSKVHRKTFLKNLTKIK